MTTPRLGIPKPTGSSNVNRASFNNIFDIIDQNVEIPADAQELATNALNAAKDYTDDEIDDLAGEGRTTENLMAVKSSIDNFVAQKNANNGLAPLDEDGDVPLANLGKIPELSADNIALDSANFTATDVEGGMDELFQSVSDGKTAVAAAITDKAVSASGSDTFAQLATKITSILRLIRYAFDSNIVYSTGVGFVSTSGTHGFGIIPTFAMVQITINSTVHLALRYTDELGNQTSKDTANLRITNLTTTQINFEVSIPGGGSYGNTEILVWGNPNP